MHALTHLTVPAVLSTLYTAWLASLVGYGIWNTLLARHRAAAVVPYTMLVPVVGLTTAWLVQGEAPNAWEATGGGAAAARGGRHDGRAGPSASAPSAGPRGGGGAAVPSAGWPSADTRPMIRGKVLPHTGTCCCSWATAGTLSASGARSGPVSVGTEASSLLVRSSRASRSASSTRAP